MWSIINAGGINNNKNATISSVQKQKGVNTLTYTITPRSLSLLIPSKHLFTCMAIKFFSHVSRAYYNLFSIPKLLVTTRRASTFNRQYHKDVQYPCYDVLVFKTWFLIIRNPSKQNGRKKFRKMDGVLSRSTTLAQPSGDDKVHLKLDTYQVVSLLFRDQLLPSRTNQLIN